MPRTMIHGDAGLYHCPRALARASNCAPRRGRVLSLRTRGCARNERFISAPDCDNGPLQPVCARRVCPIRVPHGRRPLFIGRLFAAWPVVAVTVDRAPFGPRAEAEDDARVPSKRNAVLVSSVCVHGGERRAFGMVSPANGVVSRVGPRVLCSARTCFVCVSCGVIRPVPALMRIYRRRAVILCLNCAFCVHRRVLRSHSGAEGACSFGLRCKYTARIAKNE